MKFKVAYTKQGKVEIDTLMVAGLTDQQVTDLISEKVRTDLQQNGKLSWYFLYGPTIQIDDKSTKEKEVMR